MDRFYHSDYPRYKAEYSILPSARGGTGLNTFAINSMLYAASANTWAVVAAGTNSILVSNASNVPSWSTTLPLVTLNAAQTATTPIRSTNSTLIATTAFVQSTIDPNTAAPGSDPVVTDRPHSLMNEIHSFGYRPSIALSSLRFGI